MKTFDASGRCRRTRVAGLLGALSLLLVVPVAAQDVFIEKSTNGQDADSAPGPTIVDGDPVNWSYLVTAGVRDLENINVVDDQGVTVGCPQTTLGAGASMTCTGSGLATLGQYANIGTVNADFVVNGLPVAPATDPSHYFGVPGLVLTIEKSTNGQDADVAPGPVVPAGEPISWAYLVTNIDTGTAITNVAVTDDQGVVVSCPQTTLDPLESMTCTGSGAAQSGQYVNIGEATGDFGIFPVVGTDPSHYFGQVLIVEKSTNGSDADSAPGPGIPVGDPVNWTYEVTNPGPEVVSSLVVTDDQGVVVSCPQTSLAAGESMTCTAAGVAVAGAYANIGTVGGQMASGPAISDDDPSHYLGFLPNAIVIEKSTNGVDADSLPGPVVASGSPIAWIYEVSNFGLDTVSNIVVTDDQGVTVTCPETSLDPTESMTCTANGTAIVGQYENVGTADGELPGPVLVSDIDLSHYFGQDQDVDWGDAPDPTFPTTLASAGASHVLSPTVFLGACVDSELDGQPSAGADGDDLGAGLVTNGTCAVTDDDEDGVTFLDPLIAGATVDIEVFANDACTLTAWIDFNVDGDWEEPNEDLFPGGAVLAPGLNTLSFTVPSEAFGGTSFARFRCTTDTPPEGGVFGFLGQADDGEVEDYVVSIELDLEATMVDLPGTSAMPGDLINYEATVTSVAGSAAGVDFDLTLDPNTLPSGVVTTTPLARDDGLYQVDPAVPTTVDGTGQPLLLTNDFGIPAPTAIAAVAQPTTLGGSVDINTDGSFTYTPFGGAVGGEIDSFTYDAENGIPSGGPVVDTATATMVLGGPPLAADDNADDDPAYFVLAGATLTIVDGPTDPVDRNDSLGSPPGALSHFGGGDLGGAVTDNLAGATVTPLPGFGDGSLTVNADGSFTFVTPATPLSPALSDRARGNGGPGLSGPWQFQYRLTNLSGTSDATVTIEVQLPPDAIDDGPAGGAVPGEPFATLPGVPIDSNNHATPSVLLNDILGVPAGSVTFYGTSAAPMTTPAEGGPTPTDQGGTVEVSTDGEFVYTPPGGGFAGTDAFGYVLGNPAGSDSAVVTILVAGPPIAEDDEFTVLNNPIDPDVYPLDVAPDNGFGADDFGNPVGVIDSYGAAGTHPATTPGNDYVLPSGNTVNFTGGAGVGTFVYTINGVFTGTESFEYRISNVAGSDTAIVTFEVRQPPTAVDDAPAMASVPDEPWHTALNTALDSTAHATPSVMDNDTRGFPLADVTSYGTSTSPTDVTVPGAATATDNGGTVQVFADGNFVYMPPSSTYLGTDLFGYRITNAAGMDDGVVTIAIGASPVCVIDAYGALGNVGITVPLASGLLFNDTGDQIVVSSVQGAGGNVGVATATDSLGSVTVSADGSFIYVSAPGFTGDDTFDYTAGNPVGDSLTCEATITVANTIWFIDNEAAGGGNGTLATPFDSLSAFSAGTLDGTGDVIFLDEGDGTDTDYDTGIALKNNQLFIGQGVDLATGAGITAPTFSDALPGVAGRPQMTNTTGAGITLASGNTVRGLDIGNTTGTGITGTSSAGATIDEVGLGASGGNGLSFGNCTGAIDIDNLDVTTGAAIGVSISDCSASFNFDGFSSITSPTGTAFRISGGTASVTYSGSITQANNATTVDIGGHSTGTVTFQTGTIAATNGNGLQFSNADGTYNFNGTTTLNGGGDAGIDILTGSAGTFTFANTTITSPSGVGVNVVSSSPNITYSGGGITQNNAATAYRANNNAGGTQNIGAGIIANTSTATGISLTSNTGATINFSGALDIDTTSGSGFVATGGGTVTNDSADVNTIDTTTGKGVDIDNTTIGAAGLTFRSINVDGASVGIDIDTGGTTGFFTVTGTGTTAGSGGTIQDNSQNGVLISDTNNITLTNMNLTNATDEAGGCVAGVDQAGSTLGPCTAALEFDTVSVIDVTNMTIDGDGDASDELGIFAQDVTDFDMTGVTVRDVSDGINEHGIYVVDLFGTGGSSSNWHDLVVENTIGDTGILMVQTGGTGELLIDGASRIEDALEGGFEARTDSATANLTITIGETSAVGVGDTVIVDNTNTGVAFFSQNGTLSGTVRNSIVRSGSGAATINRAGSGTNGVLFVGVAAQSTSATADVTLNVTGSDIDHEDGGAGGTGRSGIALSGSGNVNGTIANNTVDSNDEFVDAFFMNFTGVGTTSDNQVLIDGNVFTLPGSGGFFTIAGIEINAHDSSGGLSVTATNNTIFSGGVNTFSAGMVFVVDDFGGTPDTNVLCVDVTGNNASTAVGSFGDYGFVQFDTSTFNIAGLPVGPVTEAQIDAYIIANDDGAATTTAADVAVVGSINGVTSCP